MKPSSSMISALEDLFEGSEAAVLAAAVDLMEGIGIVLFESSASLDSDFAGEAVEAMSKGEIRA